VQVNEFKERYAGLDDLADIEMLSSQTALAKLEERESTCWGSLVAFTRAIAVREPT
jgi:hypothetical protein